MIVNLSLLGNHGNQIQKLLKSYLHIIVFYGASIGSCVGAYVTAHR